MSGEGGSGLRARILDPARLRSDSRAGLEKMGRNRARLKGEGGSDHEARIFDPARLTEDVDLTKYFSAAAVAKMATIEQNMYRNKVRNYWTLRALGEWGCCCHDWKGLQSLHK